MDKQLMSQLNEDRVNGLRPVVVACILNERKILFLFQREYGLWQLPQGGIEAGETIVESLEREIREELGPFANKIDTDSALLAGSDKVEFPKDNQGTREILDSSGKKHFMIGKKYYFIIVRAKGSELDIESTEFEKYRWTEIDDAGNLTSQIYQKGKKRITERALELVREYTGI